MKEVLMSKWSPRYAQLCQDLFPYLLTNGKKNGFYVDFGCRDPFKTNNTWFLEEKLDWAGISIDIVDYSKIWQQRKSQFIQADALHINIKKLFENYKVPKVVDYLTHDLEGNGDRYRGLINIPFDDYDFKIITLEHDAYRGFSKTEREPQRRFLNSKGYFLVCSNVKSHAGDSQEDWWVNPKYISREVYGKFMSESQKFNHIFKFAGYDIDKLYDFYKENNHE
tara:strand:- start:741 stop:1409 length:669 start_codon:yes stop_codon:yes gene_type:complete